MEQQKEELTEVLYAFCEVEREQEALERVLDRMELAYGDSEAEETKLIMILAKVYIRYMRMKMRNAMDRMDDVLR